MNNTQNNTEEGIEEEQVRWFVAFAIIAGAVRAAGLAVLLALLVPAAGAAQTLSNEEMQQRLEELKSQLEGMTETQLGMQSDVINLKKLKVSGYMQARYETHEDSPIDASTPTVTADRQNGFYIRRGRIKFTYAASPTSTFVIYPDMSTKDGVNLREAYVKLTEPWTGKGINLIFGQQNWFFGREIERSSSVREFPERARVFGKAVFDGERDKGARVEVPDLPFSGLNVKLGVFNGNGIKSPQAFDNDKFPHYMGRVAYTLGWLDLGVSGEQGKRFAKDSAGVKREVRKHHVGADAFVYYELPVLGGGSIGGEYLTGRGVQSPDSNQTKNMGWLASAVQSLGERFQLAYRLDYYDANTDAKNDAMTTTAVALNYFWDESVRLSAAWEHPVKETADTDDDTTTLQFQYKF